MRQWVVEGWRHEAQLGTVQIGDVTQEPLGFKVYPELQTTHEVWEDEQSAQLVTGQGEEGVMHEPERSTKYPKSHILQIDELRQTAQLASEQVGGGVAKTTHPGRLAS
jgi:hypothetical protein